MDTQGIFDNTTSQNDSARIFSLSCLISSLLIYNLKSNLEKTHFEYLNLFSQFKLISDSKFKSKSSSSTSSSSSADGVKPLQLGLTILIRDWQYPDEHFYGMTGGEKYLHERLKVNHLIHFLFKFNFFSSKYNQIYHLLKAIKFYYSRYFFRFLHSKILLKTLLKEFLFQSNIFNVNLYFNIQLIRI